MPSVVARLYSKKLITPPYWLPNNIIGEVLSGSHSYGCNDPGASDEDIVGICIPRPGIVFPHLEGHILGFGSQTKPEKFEVFQSHAIYDSEKKKDYDVAVYNIVKYFQLCMENNPNMIDTLFASTRCIRHSTKVYEHMRDNRRMFLHKGCWYKFKGYAHSQLSKITKGANKSNPKRQETIEKHGYDTKFAYHIVRLLMECEQILETHNLVLDRDREIYKSIRRGEWTLEDIQDFFDSKRKSLETLKDESKLPNYPDEDAIKKLLMECLEINFGSIQKMVTVEKQDDLLNDLERLVAKYR